MPNGKPGDNPLTDIVVYGLPVYTHKADALIREIAELGGSEQISEMLWSEYGYQPDVAKLETVLTEIRDGLRDEAKDKGRGTE